MSYPFFNSDGSSNIAAAVPHQFYQEGQNIFNNEAPLISMIEAIYGTSDAAYWTVSDGGTSFGVVGEGEQVNVSAEFNAPNVLGLSLKRQILRTGFAISNTELAQVASYNPAVASNQIKQRLRRSWLQSYASLCNGLEQQAWTGQGTATSVATGNSVPGAYGITYLLNQAQTNGSYAGQSLSSHPRLKINYQNVGGSIAQSNLDHGFSTVLEQAGSVLDDTYFFMCTPKTEAALKGIADLNTNPVSMQLVQDQEASYKLGARKPPHSRKARLSYNGIKVFPNSAMFQAGLDGYLLLASTKDIVMDVLPHVPMGMATTEGVENGVEMFGRVVNEVGLPLFYQTYANLGGVYAAFAEAEMQFIWGAPNRMFLWYGITTS